MQNAPAGASVLSLGESSRSTGLPSGEGKGPFGQLVREAPFPPNHWQPLGKAASGFHAVGRAGGQGPGCKIIGGTDDEKILVFGGSFALFHLGAGPTRVWGGWGEAEVFLSRCSDLPAWSGMLRPDPLALARLCWCPALGQFSSQSLPAATCLCHTGCDVCFASAVWNVWPLRNG